MLKREEIMDLMMEAKPVELKEYCRLVTQLLTESQLKRLQPYFTQRVDFDYRQAMEDNQKPIPKSSPKEQEKQDMNLRVTDENMVDFDVEAMRTQYPEEQPEEEEAGEEEDDGESDEDSGNEDELDDEYNVKQ